MARSSSCRREAVSAADPAHHHAKSIGCMAGIFQLVSKYQNRRKFLTIGRKQEKQAISSGKKTKPTVETPVAPRTFQEENESAIIVKKETGESFDLRRLSCDVPRSPTIPSEIRRSNPFKSQENARSPPALVARLMGLEEIPASPTPATPETAAEKRRKLLGALEKCDEDLKALKRIIETVRSSECTLTPRTPPPVSAFVGGVSGSETVKKCVNFEIKKCLSSEMEDDGGGFGKKLPAEVSGEQPSPVSVLDEFTRSPAVRSYSPETRNGRRTLPKQQMRKKPGEDDAGSLRFLNRSATAQPLHPKIDRTVAAAPWRSRSAMAQSVNEVCRDVAWGHNREVAKVGLAIQDYIYRDLIDGITRELACCDLYSSSSLPFGTCKRKLCF
ncbi:hypothetical protein Nepgr_022084 [Nepenthes gracilis]|uniref:DUF3741 domain-containing protein n=1 Tax=Nepenthes gracilis TaxID=150966 RepID=A0AAD3SZQ5_NEPGR|nr:hypothetical protein Nepgr_022084 [Nepenthes gracilis]